MGFNKKTVFLFECTNCGQKYAEPPKECPCARRNYPGRNVGPFRLVQQEEEGIWKVECLLCGLETYVSRTNLKNQKSCGCKPRKIVILRWDYDEKTCTYLCKVCNKTSTKHYPLDEFCCEI